MTLKAVFGLVLALAGAAQAGCTSFAPAPGKDQVLGGAAGDLRVLLDGACPEAAPPPVRYNDAAPDRGLEMDLFSGLGLDMLAKFGGIAFESFGTYLKRAGQENVTRSAGANGGLFYSSPGSNDDVSINPQLRCIYLVRNGYAPQDAVFTGNVPADLKSLWTRLGLTRTPDLFAQLHIQTSGDIGGGALVPLEGATPENDDNAPPAFWNPAVSPPYFRLLLDRLYISQFQSVSGSPARDLALIFNYGLAAASTVVVADGANAGTPELARKFAVGGIRLPGAQPGDYKGASLTALQSAWMPVPGVKSYDPRATVDVVAYVVEFAPGNEMLEDIGEYLAGDDMRRKVEAALTPTGD